MDTQVEYAIEVNNLTKEFSTSKGKVKAVDNISFKVEKGHICGFVGPNGAGKSTTIKMLLGLLKPTSGDIKLNNGSIKDPRIRKIIGYMPEKDTFYEDMPAWDYLLMMAMLSGMSKKDAKENAENLINTLGLENAKKRAITRYSSGMKKKISFAQAIIHKPKIMILDEPTANLDPIAQAQLISILKENCKNNGMSVFISSHHIEELEKLIDDIVVINNGKIMLSSSLEDIKKKTTKTIEIQTQNNIDAQKVYEIVKSLGIIPKQSESKVTAPVKGEDANTIQRNIMQKLVKANISVQNITVKDESLWDFVLDLLEKDKQN